MGVTNQMILDLFGQGSRYRADPARKPAQYTCLIDRERELPAGVDESEALLVASPAAAVEALGALPRLHAMCNVRGLADAERANLEAEERLLCIDVELTDERIYRQVGSLFKEVQSWCLKMYRMLVEGCSYSDLLDLSVPIIGCPIVMSGAGLELEGYTTALPPANDIAEGIIDLGYFDEEAVDYFRDSSMPRLWSKLEGLVLLDKATSHRDYPLFFYVFHLDDDYRLHCAIHLSSKEPTFGLADKVGLLVEAIELHLRINPPSQLMFKQGVSALLAQCASGSMAPNKRVREAFLKAGVDERTRFRLHLLDYGYSPDEDALAVKMGLDLVQRAPTTLVALMDGCVIVLEREPDQSTYPTLLQEHSKQHPCALSSSDVLTCIERIPLAYRQAQAARLVAHRREPRAVGVTTTFTQAFASYFLMEGRSEQVVEDALEIAVPTRIAAEDARNGTNDLEILRCFLACERRANDAAARLFIHRNTLLYRIHRIERIYGISLDDEPTRARLRTELVLMHEI